jgi:hypothetical protein
MRAEVEALTTYNIQLAALRRADGHALSRRNILLERDAPEATAVVTRASSRSPPEHQGSEDIRMERVFRPVSTLCLGVLVVSAGRQLIPGSRIIDGASQSSNFHLAVALCWSGGHCRARAKTNRAVAAPSRWC